MPHKILMKTLGEPSPHKDGPRDGKLNGETRERKGRWRCFKSLQMEPVQPVYCGSNEHIISCVIHCVLLLLIHKASVTWGTSVISERRYDSLGWKYGIVSNSTTVF